MLYAASTGGFYTPEIHGANIPPDAVEVTDSIYAALLSGQAEGKVIVPDGSGSPVLQDRPPPSVDEIKTLKIKVVQQFIDEKAQSLGYDNIYTAVTYADEPAVPKFQAEGRALRAWRSLVWAKANEILAAVTAGTQDVPTDDELIGALPAFTAPST